MSELRPQISKTRVGFTQNRIHLALVYLHLTHQMQFCKSHSIAKRHFCLSCPSEGSGGWGGEHCFCRDRDRVAELRGGG